MIRIRHIPAEQIFLWMDKYGVLSQSEPRWMTCWRSAEAEFVLLPAHQCKYLYRGQTARYSPCLPTIARGTSTEKGQLECLLNFVRLHWFGEMLNQHAWIRFLSSANLSVNRLELAQHYGVKTHLIDLTESIEVAAFFATCYYSDNAWYPRDSGVGYLYRLNWEETPQPVRSRLRPIGLQPFERPYAQRAWTYTLYQDEDFEEVAGVEVVAFQHSRKVGEELLRLFDGGRKLFPVDILADWVHRINRSRHLPLDLAFSILQKGAQNQPGIDERLYVQSRLEDMQRLLGVSFGPLPIVALIPDNEVTELNRSFNASKEQFMEKVQRTADYVFTR